MVFYFIIKSAVKKIVQNSFLFLRQHRIQRNKYCTFFFMKSIRHLSPEEQKHFVLCDCGEYFDMRDLSEVFNHFHANLPEPEWSYSIKKDEAVAYFKSGKRIDLN